MAQDRTIFLASLFVLFSGICWGFYWLPVRALEQAGLTGAWGTAAITVVGTLALAPFAIRRRRTLRRADGMALLSLAIGGAAFTLYSVGFVYGRVALIILLFFLTPVWSTLIGRYVMGWHTPPMRVVAILMGLGGLGLMLSAGGDWPVPRSLGEWMALAAGILWSVGSTGIRVRSAIAPAEAAFVFALGAAVTALALAPLLGPLPVVAGAADWLRIFLVSVLTGALWWGLTIIGLMWATVRLEPARVGILLMSEVLVGAVSAAILAGEHLSALEYAGGALVLLAGLLETVPVRRFGRKPRMH